MQPRRSAAMCASTTVVRGNAPVVAIGAVNLFEGKGGGEYGSAARLDSVVTVPGVPSSPVSLSPVHPPGQLILAVLEGELDDPLGYGRHDPAVMAGIPVTATGPRR